ncbi:Fc.00g072690.m01.CDS01 [Cosmosporella sp. VM-42]
MSHITQLPSFKRQGNGSALRSRSIAERWAKDFEQALRDADFDKASDALVEDAWIRDFLAVTWDFRTIHGRDEVIQYLKDNIQAGICNIRLQEHGSFKPTFKNPCPGLHWVESMFKFETRFGRGKGMLRLVMDGEDETWKCYLINFTLQELKGHEEQLGIDRPQGYVDITGGNWQQRRDRQREFLDEDPTAFVLNAKLANNSIIGQAGLTIAARLQQLGVPTLIIERNERVGDSWRKRYKTLMTHDPIHYCHLPYLPFPSHWPFFMPKDKLADWLESYSNLMELNVWCKTELRSSSFNETTHTWAVTVKRADGSTRTLNPKHVVLATGNSGDAIVPHFPGQDDYQGIIFHGSQHTDASAYEELPTKRVVVVGSGNSAHDLCQNFYECGAGSVTMLQRGGTYVLTAKKGLLMLHTGSYEEGGPPTEDCDISSQSMPIPIQFGVNVFGTEAISAVDKDTLDGLSKRGFQLDYGEDGSGIYRRYITRGGGYYIDVGCSQLIIDGKVKVKSSPGGIQQLTSNGLILSNGTELKADIVVLATGYHTMRSTAQALFGDSVTSRLGKVWDLNEEGEVNAMWRQSGHPNFWFMGGNLALCRSYSRLLALQIKAAELGIYEAPGKQPNCIPNGT